MADRERPEPGLYRHFKGGIYFVHDVVRHTETGEELVLYAQAGKLRTGQWVRPLTMFFENVLNDEGETVPRFSRLPG